MLLHQLIKKYITVFQFKTREKSFLSIIFTLTLPPTPPPPARQLEMMGKLVVLISGANGRVIVRGGRQRVSG